MHSLLFFLSQEALLFLSLSLSLSLWLGRNCRVSSIITDTILFLRSPCPFDNNRENKQSHRVKEPISLPCVPSQPPTVKDRGVFGLVLGALVAFLSAFVRFKSHRSQRGRKPRCQALCGSFYESFPGYSESCTAFYS